MTNLINAGAGCRFTFLNIDVNAEGLLKSVAGALFNGVGKLLGAAPLAGWDPYPHGYRRFPLDGSEGLELNYNSREVFLRRGEGEIVLCVAAHSECAEGDHECQNCAFYEFH